MGWWSLMQRSWAACEDVRRWRCLRRRKVLERDPLIVGAVRWDLGCFGYRVMLVGRRISVEVALGILSVGAGDVCTAVLETVRPPSFVFTFVFQCLWSFPVLLHSVDLDCTQL
jgi:hypothetical protein